MKKGGVREINSFISIPNTDRGPARFVDRHQTSLQKARSTLLDSSKVNLVKKTLSKASTPAELAKSTLTNKPRVSDTPRKSISTGPNDGATKATRSDRSSILSRTNSTHAQDERTSLLRRQSRSYTQPISALQKSSATKTTVRKPSIEETKLDLRRNSSVSSTSKANIVKQSSTPPIKIPEEPTADEEYDYEDDFEDYESDFESLSESPSSSSGIDDDDVQTPTRILVEEERKMDSGSYDLTYLQNLQKQKKQLEVIKEALNKENAIVQQSANSTPIIQSSEHDSLVEEGHENTKILLDLNTRSVENFTSAKNRQQNLKIAHKITTRGEKLLQMITLDTMSFSLFEMAPVPYHIFMRSYARKNTVQAFTQTNEDNSSCEIQTEDISLSTKWTQHPIVVTKQILESEHNFSEILNGVGDEAQNSENIIQPSLETNTQKLTAFMKWAGEEIIAFLEEELFKTELTEDTYTSKNTEISECVSSLKVETIPFLSGSPVLFVQYDPCNNFRILTVHWLEKNDLNQKECCSYLCIWNIHQFWKPKLVLKSHNKVTSCCFTGYDSSFIVAGHEDGSLYVWNLREHFLHSEKLSVNNTEICVQYPSVNTAERRDDTIHKSRIISVKSIRSNNLDLRSPSELRFEKIFSIDDDNILIIWSLLSRSKEKILPWGKTNFIGDQILDVGKKLQKIKFQTTCLRIICESKILIGTDVGSVLQCNLYVKNLKIHRRRSSKNILEQSRITCLEICPYNSQYFVVGYSNGNVSLFNSQYTEPISNIENYSPFSSAIRVIQWLWSKLDHVLVLDVNFLFSIYRFYPDDYSLIRRSKIDGVYAVQVSSSDYRWQHSTLHFVLLIDNEIQVHKLKSIDDWTR